MNSAIISDVKNNIIGIFSRTVLLFTMAVIKYPNVYVYMIRFREICSLRGFVSVNMNALVHVFLRSGGAKNLPIDGESKIAPTEAINNPIEYISDRMS